MTARPPLPAGPASIDITIDDARWRDADELCGHIREAAAATLAFLAERGLPTGEVSVLLTDDRHIERLNRDFRGIDNPTNVLSFAQDDQPMPPGETAPHLLGDIVLAYDTIRGEATAAERPFLNHVSHLVVHGLLHLQGFDHQDETEALEMEQMERHILATLGVPDPYSAEVPKPTNLSR